MMSFGDHFKLTKSKKKVHEIFHKFTKLDLGLDKLQTAAAAGAVTPLPISIQAGVIYSACALLWLRKIAAVSLMLLTKYTEVYKIYVV